jgi:hypothetical protein
LAVKKVGWWAAPKVPKRVEQKGFERVVVKADLMDLFVAVMMAALKDETTASQTVEWKEVWMVGWRGLTKVEQLAAS